jgi:hypothetical protein
MKLNYTVLAVFLLMLTSGCESLKEWDADIKSRPAGVGIQGAAIVRGLITVVKKYEATPKQKEEAKVEAAKVVAKLTPKQKEELKESPLIAVEILPDDRADKSAKKSVIIFNTSSEEIVGNNVYDIKPSASAKKGSVSKEDLVKTEIDGFSVSYYGIDSLVN